MPFYLFDLPSTVRVDIARHAIRTGRALGDVVVDAWTAYAATHPVPPKPPSDNPYAHEEAEYASR